MSDLISREAAAKMLRDKVKKLITTKEPMTNEGVITRLAITEAAFDIENMPAVDAKPVRCGQWRVYSKTRSFDILHLGSMFRRYVVMKYLPTTLGLRCSECGKVTYVNDSIAYNYCPHCGANMDLEESDAPDR